MQNFLPSYILHILIKNKAENAFDMFESTERRKIRLIEGNAKCRHLKKLTCKETLRQKFIRVYRLELQSVMLDFSTQLCELLPL